MLALLSAGSVRHESRNGLFDMPVIHGDCLDVLKTLDAESIDACVTDPPYGLEFMGKEWDAPWKHTFTEAGTRPGLMLPVSSTRNPVCRTCRKHQRGSKQCQCATPDYDETPRSNGVLFEAWTETWAREVLRVLKPGAHILVCGAPRAYHRMASGLEDAGFEIRDCLAWLFGSGFPKSLNLGEGLGTALKPAHEPIVLARKPFKGTVKGNVERFGTGALNIDACRIAFASDEDQAAAAAAAAAQRAGHQKAGEGVYEMGFNDGPGSIAPYIERMDMGRWPANVVIDDLAALVIDEQSGELQSGGTPDHRHADKFRNTFGTFKGGESENGIGASEGGAARFYYCAKPSREERDMGCYGVEPRQRDESRQALAPGGNNPRNRGAQPRGNFHPTVKPIELMRWLIKLVTPINGTVLDPFLGSGTTGMAAKYEQRSFIGIEREAEYLEIAERRIAAVSPLFSVAEGVTAAAVDPVDRSSTSRPRAADLFAEDR